MTPSRFHRILLLTVLVFVLTAGSALAQGNTTRTPEAMSLVMTGAPASFESADFANPAQVYDLAEGGTALTAAIASQGAVSQQYGWVTVELFNETGVPATPVGNGTLTISISPNTAPQAIAASDVTFTLEYGYFAPGANLHVHALGQSPAVATPTTPAGTLPVPGVPGTLPGSVSFTLDFDGNEHQVPAGGRIALRLAVESSQAADFSFTTDGFPTLSYVYGDPDDPDTDGDGIPDPLDDDADADGFSKADEEAAGTSDANAAANPGMDADGDGFTLQDEIDAGTSDNDPEDFPGAGGFPWLLILLVVLVVVLLAGAGFAVLTVVGRKVKVEVSHDGFQSIEQGETAEYEVTVYATGKKEELVPVELSLKGVPEDWTATLEPAHMELYAGQETEEDEEPEGQVAILRLTPPADEQYEAEAQVTVTATPTDEEGNTSAMNPGSSAKTKTIVNIGVTDPDGGKKKKRKKGDDDEEADDGDDDGDADAPGAAAAAASSDAGDDKPKKPSIGMGKMVHDPADFSEGDEVTTTVKVRNKGDDPVEGLRLNLFVNDEKADSQEVTLDAGASEEVTFTWTAQADENRVRIKGGLKEA